jgi:competence protein ComEA
MKELEMKEWPTWLHTSIGILFGLVVGGIILFIARQPTGQSVELLPRPTAAPILVHVTGAVNIPGVYSLALTSRVQQAIEAAGGPTSEADLTAINQAAPLIDGQQITVPTKGQIRPIESSSGRLINLNTASLDELMTLPGIGEDRANAIIAYRSKSGGFKTIENILDISGIGPSTFDRLKDLITVLPQP